MGTYDTQFDEFFKNFLETEPSKLNDRDVRKFTYEFPNEYVVPDDRYQILYKALFKIKNFENRALFNDSLAMIEKCFKTLDFNQFLVGFWSCDEIKDRELGPIGYSYTEGKPQYTLSDVRPHDNNVALKNAKAIEIAYSMLLDVEATVDSLLKSWMDDKPMAVFFAVVSRQFKCLGDYMIKINNKEIPLYLYFFRKAHDQAVASGHLLSTVLSCLISVTWTPKVGAHRWCALKPNYALCEIMDYFLRDSDEQQKYLTALGRFFRPFDNFECNIQWNPESNNFDNPSIFLQNFIRYFNRKNSIIFNGDFFGVLECVKKSLHQSGVVIESFEIPEESVEIDWPFAYYVLDALEIPRLKRHISESIFKALPENATAKYLSLNEEEPSLEKALVGIFELYFICRSSIPIPDAFYKKLLTTYGNPKSVVDTFAKCILQACNNLKNSICIKIDAKFIDFIARICEFALDNKIFEQFSSMVEMDTDLIHLSIHLVIIGRVIRLPLEEAYHRDHRRPYFSDLDDYIHDLFKVYTVKVYNKFGEYRSKYNNYRPPWRKGNNDPVLDDSISMALNHILNAIQKEAFCIHDTKFGANDEVLDFLFLLYKERRHFGFTFSRLDITIQKSYPSYFERFDTLNQQPPPQHQQQQHQQNYGLGDNRVHGRQSRNSNY